MTACGSMRKSTSMYSGLSMPFKNACAQSSLMLLLSWPTLPVPMLPIRLLTASTLMRMGFLTRCASSVNSILMMSSFSPSERDASVGIAMIFGMRRTNVFVSADFGSSVVAPMISTFALRERVVSPRRLYVPVSMK